MKESPSVSSTRKRLKPSIDTIDEATGVLRSMRVTQPAHFMFKIDSFSALKISLEKGGHDSIELTKFPAGGYTWVMSIYPNGNSKDNGSGYLSFYLKLVDELGGGSTVVVTLRFFIYDQIQDNYLTIHDLREKHFHAVRNEWGISKVISKGAFNDPSNGFLVNDSCAFGAEVFVLNRRSQVARLSLFKDSQTPIYTWEIKRFSYLKNPTYSPEFNIKGRSWKLRIDPEGYGEAKGRSLSVFLCPTGCEFTTGEKLYAAFKLAVKNSGDGKDRDIYYNWWFSKSEMGYGNSSFLPLSDLNCPSKGFKVNDVVTVEIKIDRSFSAESYLMEELEQPL